MLTMHIDTCKEEEEEGKGVKEENKTNKDKNTLSDTILICQISGILTWTGTQKGMSLLMRGPYSYTGCRQKWVPRPITGMFCTVQWAVCLDRLLLSILDSHREVQVHWCKWAVCLPATYNVLSFTVEAQNPISFQATSMDLTDEGITLRSALKCENIGNLDSALLLRIPWAPGYRMAVPGGEWRAGVQGPASSHSCMACPQDFRGDMSGVSGSWIQLADHLIFSSSLELLSYRDVEPALNWSQHGLEDQYHQFWSRVIFRQHRNTASHVNCVKHIIVRIVKSEQRQPAHLNVSLNMLSLCRPWPVRSHS